MTKDLSAAYKWFSLAATGGDAEAAKRRAVIRVQLAPATLAAADATVTAWAAKPAAAKKAAPKKAAPRKTAASTTKKAPPAKKS